MAKEKLVAWVIVKRLEILHLVIAYPAIYVILYTNGLCEKRLSRAVLRYRYEVFANDRFYD